MNDLGDEISSCDGEKKIIVFLSNFIPQDIPKRDNLRAVHQTFEVNLIRGPLIPKVVYASRLCK